MLRPHEGEVVSIGLSVDRYAALIVVAFIGRTAFMIFLDAVRVLLDASLDHDSLEHIRQIVLADPRVVDMVIVRKELGGKGMGYVLGNAEVEVLVVKETDADPALATIKAELERR